MELSVNFLVVLIMAIVVFGLSITLLYKIVDKTEGLRGKQLDELDRAIGYLTCKSADQVCFDTTRKTIPRSEFQLFTIKILNINNQRTRFRVRFRTEEVGGFDSADLFRLPREREVLISPDKEEQFALGVEVPDDALSGTYVFNIRVQYCEQDPFDPCVTWKDYKDPVYKLTVIVP
jgi:hypothetical protein